MNKFVVPVFCWLTVSVLFAPQATCLADGAAITNEGIIICERGKYIPRGMGFLEKGDEALKVRDYEKASAYYKTACDYLPDAKATKAAYDRAVDGFCKASCGLAESRVAEGRYKDAQSLLHVVLDDRYNPRCKEAIRLLTKLEDPEWYNETIGPHYRARLERVKQLMIEAQGYYDAERDDLAFKRCEQVMEIDPYSKAARALEERIRNRAASKSR